MRNRRPNAHRSKRGGFLATISSLLGLSINAGNVQAADVSAAAQPQAWVEYGAVVSTELASWLVTDSDAASRLNNYVERALAANAQVEATLPVSIWLNSSGEIVRLSHRRLLHEQANRDLEALVLGRMFSAPPPAGLRLPIRLQLRLRAPQVKSIQANAATPSITF